LQIVPQFAAVCKAVSRIYSCVSGGSDFMLKPFDPGELLRLTAQAFRRD
jgi:hypothetical protein